MTVRVHRHGNIVVWNYEKGHPASYVVAHQTKEYVRNHSDLVLLSNYSLINNGDIEAKKGPWGAPHLPAFVKPESL